jgi:hypothetical protein
MPSSSRDAVLSFAAGALLALVIVRIVPGAVTRVACGGDCTTGVASTRPATRLARNDEIRGGRRARNDAAPGTSSVRPDSGAGLYVMLAPEATTARVAPAPVPSDAAVAAPSPDAAELVAKEGEAPTASTSPPRDLDVASTTVETAPPAAVPPPNDTGPATAVGSLDGWWLVTNAVDSSDRRTSKGPLMVYRINLRQDGERVSGKGSTWSKNGQVLTPSQRTPIVATGTRRDDRVELVLVEHASRGTRQGHIEWRPTGDGDAFAGRFASEATHTSGRSEAVRELSAPADEPRKESRRPRHHARTHRR